MRFRKWLLVPVLTLAACAPDTSSDQQNNAAIPEQELEEPLKQASPIVPQEQITALFTCIKADTCRAPVKILVTSDKEKMRTIVALGEYGTIYHFFYTDRNRFGVVMEDANRDVLILTDNDRDGKADSFGLILGELEGETEINEDHPSYPKMQNAYFETMAISAQLVPKNTSESDAIRI